MLLRLLESFLWENFTSISENRQNRKWRIKRESGPINHRKTMDRNDSSDAEEILNAYLHSYDGPQIQLWACYAAKRAGTGQD